MKPVFMCLLLLISMASHAQRRPKATITADVPAKGQLITIPYGTVRVIDARFDQSKIGCIFNRLTPFDFSMYVYKQDAVFPEALDTYLPQFMKTFLTTDSTQKDELAVLVKRFRIADYCSYSEKNNADVRLTLNLSVSFYALHEGRYSKLFSIDNVTAHSIYSLHGKGPDPIHNDIRAGALREMLYNLLQQKSWVPAPMAPSYSAEDVAAALARRFSLPVYDSVARTGLYKNFREFKNNTPSVTNITVLYKNGKISAVRDQRGRNMDLLDYWGLSYANKRYMIFRDEPVELLPCDKSFRVQSYRTESDTRGKATIAKAVEQYGMVSTILARSDETMRTPEYFDLDMDSGDLFLEEMFGMSATASLAQKSGK